MYTYIYIYTHYCSMYHTNIRDPTLLLRRVEPPAIRGYIYIYIYICIAVRGTYIYIYIYIHSIIAIIIYPNIVNHIIIIIYPNSDYPPIGPQVQEPLRLRRRGVLEYRNTLPIKQTYIVILQL